MKLIKVTDNMQNMMNKECQYPSEDELLVTLKNYESMREQQNQSKTILNTKCVGAIFNHD
jgi:hypothetical protein